MCATAKPRLADHREYLTNVTRQCRLLDHAEMVTAEMGEFLRTSEITERPTFVYAFAKAIRFSPRTGNRQLHDAGTIWLTPPRLVKGRAISVALEGFEPPASTVRLWHSPN